MAVLVRVFSSTPPWVFALLAYLVWQGIRSLTARTIPVWRALVVPAIFIILGVARIALEPRLSAASCLWWLAGALLSVPLAFLYGPRLLAVDRENSLITRPGSPVSLIRNVIVFLLQYAAAVAAAMQLSGSSGMATLAHVVSGGSAGYFACWSVLLLRQVRTARTGIA